MPWRPEDWERWIDEWHEGAYGDPPHMLALREVLTKIPGRRRKTVATLESDLNPQTSFLVEHFARVVPVTCSLESPVTGAWDGDAVVLPLRRNRRRTPRPFPGQFEVVVAVDSILGPQIGDVDRALEQVHGSLVEGGILLATFPATRRGVPLPMIPGDNTDDAPAGPFHEVELQYRLRRVGFQGVRIRRFDQGVTDEDTLLCMAVRRASN